MRAEYRDLDPVMRQQGTSRAQWHRRVPVHPRAECRQHAVAPGRAHQGHAMREAAGIEPTRHRQRRQIQQIHEIGIGAELRIEPQRLRRDLRQAERGGGGRQQ